MSDSDSFFEDDDEIEDGLGVLQLTDGKTTVNDVVDALFEHVCNLQQFMAEHGHTEKEFKSWLKEYERRSMN